MKNTEKKDEDLVKIVQPLVDWYRENKRDLPWRHNPDAYRVWISEIMLQQTRVEAVKGYYDRFLKALPTVKDLAEAEEDKLLKLWEGLGYYNRVRNMQKAAQQIMVDHEGIFPDNYEEILQLKGIGNYTAGAISAFAYGIPKPAVDGNVLRVISRITGSYEDIMKQSVRRKIENTLEQVIPSDAASDFNQGLIELGAIVCVPNGEPKCEECPVKEYCIACKENLTAEIPVKKKAKTRKIEERTILIFQNSRIRHTGVKFFLILFIDAVVLSIFYIHPIRILCIRAVAELKNIRDMHIIRHHFFCKPGNILIGSPISLIRGLKLSCFKIFFRLIPQQICLFRKHNLIG